MANLTLHLRSRITNAILAHRYGNTIRELNDAKAKLGDKLYDAVYSADVQAKMAALPRGFFIENNTLRVRYPDASGSWDNVPLSENRLHANHTSQGYLEANQHPHLRTQLQALHALKQEQATIERRRDEDRQAVQQQLLQYRTTAQLRTAWPEIETFIPPEPAKTNRALLKPPAELNARLGLPPT
jgi:hypothetical protein